MRIVSIKLIALLTLFIPLGNSVHAAETLNLPLTVKEVAGVESKGYPITAVVPLPKGAYKDISRFRVVDSSGNAVPAQFDVLNRWWFQDNSIRHLSIKFQPSVGAFTAIRKGISTYHLRDDGFGNSLKTNLNLKQTKDFIEVVTGPLKFTVSKNRLNIIDELWLDQNDNAVFEDSEKIINSSSENGGIFVGRLLGDIQFDSSRSDIRVVVEESGPMRAVIRANALTKYYSTSDHIHGFAVRIYAYANKPFLKIDYQLQNSAKNKKHAWPLYFEEMRLDFSLNLDSNPIVRVGTGDGRVYKRERGNGLYFAQEFHDIVNVYDIQTRTVLQSDKFTPDKLTNRTTNGFLDVSDSKRGVTAMIRYLWQTWPNGLAIDSQNKLSVQLFPNWSAQWFRNKISPTGLYWLEDMQHVYKETLLYFHGTKIDDKELIWLAKTFQYPPVVTLPTSWYKKTKASLDMGGLIPIVKRKSSSDKRLPQYKKKYFNSVKPKEYKFNWDNFLIPLRKWNTATAGGWPRAAAQVIASENPSDYYFAEQLAIGELNVRPHWVAGYNHEQDYKKLQLNYRLPFIARSWRRHSSGNKPSYLDAPYLKGTYGDASPRDDAHGWYYHVEEAYYFTANPWIRDWYEFIGEMRKGQLYNPVKRGGASRAIGHMLSNAMQAHRVTGDISILDGVREYLTSKLRNDQNSYFGYRNSLCCGKHGEAAFQAGFLLRALINFMEEVRGKDWQAYAEAFQFVSGYMEWNYNFSNFANYINARKGETRKSHFSALTFVDPQAWYYLHTGKQKYLNHLNEYIDTGMNGGSKPRRSVINWKGQFEGRYGQFVRENIKNDTTPPDTINDLTAARTGEDIITLVWTAPQDAVRYHIVYSKKPISEDMTTNYGFQNWWAAKVIGTDLVVKPGEQQRLTIKSIQSFPLYFAVFSFDKMDNMSSMSNVALVTLSCSELSGIKCQSNMICMGTPTTSNDTKADETCCVGTCDEPGMVLYFSFDDSDVIRNTVYDRSGNGNHGIIKGATFNPTGGISGGAFEFDGIDDYIEIPDGYSLNPSRGITYGAWLKSKNPKTNSGLISKYVTSKNQRSYVLRFANSDSTKIIAGVSIGGTWVRNVLTSTSTSPGVISPDTWNHVVVVFKGGDYLKIYVNGVENGSTTSDVIHSLYDNNAPLWIGVSNKLKDKTRYFNGTIDEVRIYNYALTPEEITSLYSNNSYQRSVK